MVPIATSKKHSGAAEPNSGDAEPTGSTERTGVLLKEAPTGEKPNGAAGFMVQQNVKDLY